MANCNQGTLSLPPEYKVIKVFDGKFALYQCQPDYQFKSDSEGVLWCSDGKWNQDNLASCVARETLTTVTDSPGVSFDFTSIEVVTQEPIQNSETSTNTGKSNTQTSSSTSNFIYTGVKGNTDKLKNRVTSTAESTNKNTLWNKKVTKVFTAETFHTFIQGNDSKEYITGTTEKGLISDNTITESRGILTGESETTSWNNKGTKITESVSKSFEKNSRDNQITSFTESITNDQSSWNRKTHSIEITTQTNGENISPGNEISDTTLWNKKITHSQEKTTEINDNTLWDNEVTHSKELTTGTSLLNRITNYKNLADTSMSQVTEHTQPGSFSPKMVETTTGNPGTFEMTDSNHRTSTTSVDGIIMPSSPAYLWVVILGSVAGFLVLLAISILLIHYIVKKRRKNEHSIKGKRNSESKPKALVSANATVLAVNKSLQNTESAQSDLTGSGSNLYQKIDSVSGNSSSGASRTSFRKVNGSDNPPLTFRYNSPPDIRSTKEQEMSSDRDTITSLSAGFVASKQRLPIPKFHAEIKDEFRVTASVADLEDEGDEEGDNSKNVWRDFDPGLFVRYQPETAEKGKRQKSRKSFSSE